MVLLPGTISNRFPGEKAAFALGAMTASFLFFFCRCFGAAGLRPVFARPVAWRILDLGIAAAMGLVAYRLIAGL